MSFRAGIDPSGIFYNERGNMMSRIASFRVLDARISVAALDDGCASHSTMSRYVVCLTVTIIFCPRKQPCRNGRQSSAQKDKQKERHRAHRPANSFARRWTISARQARRPVGQAGDSDRTSKARRAGVDLPPPKKGTVSGKDTSQRRSAATEAGTAGRSKRIENAFPRDIGGAEARRSRRRFETALARQAAAASRRTLRTAPRPRRRRCS